MRRALLPALLLAPLILGGCAGLSRQGGTAPSEPPVAVTLDPDDAVTRPQARPGAAVAGAASRPRGRAPEALDTTSAAERAAAAAAARAGGRALGETLAGLGNPAEAGFWLRTGLVDRVREGRVETTTGAAVGVELRPSGSAPGSGSQISLAALRALGLPLTQLATLRVFAND